MDAPTSPSQPETPFLTARNLCTYFPVKKGFFGESSGEVIKAVDDVSFTIERGEILGLVGESGCGKTTLSRTVMHLVPATSGSVILDGVEYAHMPAGQLQRARLDFQMVFQDPYASLNPRHTVFSTLAEALCTRGRLRGEALMAKVAELMARVGLNPRAMRKYPHEFSGGQRQRIAVARALAPRPKLLIADEPVSALDVSIQSQILNLLRGLVRDLGLTMMFISHDLSVVRYISDRIAVMQAGKLVEVGGAAKIMDAPEHPYTKSLLKAIPQIDLRSIKDRLAAAPTS